MNAFTLLVVAGAVAALPDRPAALEKSWYAPQEMLPLLAKRDEVRWAMPETLAGRAWVGWPKLIRFIHHERRDGR